MSAPRVGYHQFSTHRRHPGQDGGNLAYTELGQLLAEEKRIETRPHDIREVCRSLGDARRALDRCDVVVATVGPHAYLYHYLRERLNLEFRIIRDVRTALWNGYFLQEVLCKPYLRDGDVLIHSSRYSRELYMHVFPHLRSAAHSLCYPLARWFPQSYAGAWPGPRRGQSLRLAFVGRLTRDKNVDDAVAIFRKVREVRRDSTLTLVGHGSSAVTRALIAQAGEAANGLRFVGPLGRTELWELYRSSDAILFPSTSSLETFGRVLAEASHVGVPVVAADHAAAPEILPPSSIVRTRYRTGVWFDAHEAWPMATIDTDDAAERVLSGTLEGGGSRFESSYLGHAELLIDLLADTSSILNSCNGDRVPDTVRRIRVRGTEVDYRRASTDRIVEKLARTFLDLHGQRGALRHWAACARLLSRTRRPMRTAQFVKRNLLLGEDYSNIGGMDRQFSHLVRFYPAFTLMSSRREHS